MDQVFSASLFSLLSLFFIVRSVLDTMCSLMVD